MLQRVFYGWDLPIPTTVYLLLSRTPQNRYWLSLWPFSLRILRDAVQDGNIYLMDFFSQSLNFWSYLIRQSAQGNPNRRRMFQAIHFDRIRFTHAKEFKVILYFAIIQFLSYLRP